MSRELLIKACTKIAPDFTIGIERVHNVGESILWRATIGEHRHAGSVKLRPLQRLADEEDLLRKAHALLIEIQKREPKPEETQPTE